MNRVASRVLIASVTLATASVLSSCQRSSYYSAIHPETANPPDSGVQLASSGGNGVGFEGYIARYGYFDPAQVCSDTDAAGKALPNQEIVTYDTGGGRAAELVRNRCAALAPPLALNPSALSFATDGSGDLTYNGKLFEPMSSPGPVASPSPLVSPSPPAAPPTAWVKNGSVLTMNAALAPDGTNSATLFQEDRSNSYHQVWIASSYTPGTLVTFSVYVKAAGCNTVYFGIQDNTVWSDSIDYEFDLVGGVVSYPQTDGTGSGLSYQFKPVSNGWWQLSISGIPTTRYGNLMAFVNLVGPVASQYYLPFVGDGVSGAYVWGAKLQ